MKRVVKKSIVEELFSVRGKIALITGIGGIGTAIAKAFAQNGATVVLTDVDELALANVKDEIIRKGNVADAFKMDVAKKEDIISVVQKIVDKYKAIDILIHTAATASISPSGVLDYPEEAIDKIIEINLKGTILCNQCVGNIMARQKEGKIINISSIGGYMTTSMKSMPYAASKAAVHQVTRSFAYELASYGINVNTIAPAWVNTKMVAGRENSYYDSIKMNTPFGRLLEPEELIGATMFLASDASNFVTGQIIFVDGGYTSIKAVLS